MFNVEPGRINICSTPTPPQHLLLTYPHTQCLQGLPSSSTPCTAMSPSVSPPLSLSFLFSLTPPLTVAEGVKSGLEAAGGSATIFQFVLSSRSHPTPPNLSFYRVAETLPQDVLTKLHAPEKSNYPIFAPGDLVNYDAFLFGVPTRYGSFPAQWKVIPRSPPRLFDKIAETDPQIRHRPSGTLPVVSGPRVPSPASTLVSLFPPVPLVEDRR